MFVTLVPFGIIVVFSSILLFRWSAIAQLRSLGLVATIVEFGLVLLYIPCITSADSVMRLSLYSINLASYFVNISLLFDQISAVFICILCSALILCFTFLAEYFEYDVNGSQIVMLSVAFSQLAMAFFLVDDLFLMLVLWE